MEKLGCQMFARAVLRAYQSVKGQHPDPKLTADLANVQHKKLDMLVRLGGMLAFNALLITAAINPIAASPPISYPSTNKPPSSGDMLR